jgi:ORF6N domain
LTYFPEIIRLLLRFKVFLGIKEIVKGDPMSEKLERYDVRVIEPQILSIRGQRVVLDTELARIYGVPTFRFNEAVKRNRNRFPKDFMFQLTHEEVSSLTSQVAMSKPGRGGRRTLPYAFTEHGERQGPSGENCQRNTFR